jgi:hypothetical protein
MSYVNPAQNSGSPWQPTPSATELLAGPAASSQAQAESQGPMGEDTPIQPAKPIALPNDLMVFHAQRDLDEDDNEYFDIWADGEEEEFDQTLLLPQA